MAYVHGYDPRASERLHDQASTLVDLLHHDTAYPDGSSVLEAGCGVGAQTVTLATRSTGAGFTSIEMSEESVAEARRRVEQAGVGNVELMQAEHLARPGEIVLDRGKVVCEQRALLLGPTFGPPSEEDNRRTWLTAEREQHREIGVGGHQHPILLACALEHLLIGRGGQPVVAHVRRVMAEGGDLFGETGRERVVYQEPQPAAPSGSSRSRTASAA